MAQELGQVDSPAPLVIQVEHSGDVSRCREAARSFALSLGFSQEHGEEIAVVATELATNLLRYAVRGSITLGRAADDTRIGIRIESDDSGPGIPDIEQAMADGYSTGGGLGVGLGTINRMMDELDIYSDPGGGLKVICQRWIRAPQSGVVLGAPLTFGAATRARRLYEENGDTFVIKQWDGSALAGVIDGLGHGPLAHRASQTARRYIEQHFDQPLPQLFRGADRACRATRGVVMALARFDFKGAAVTVASVGNIEVRIFGSAQPFRPVVRRGIVGLNAPNPVCTDHPWQTSNVLVMHSDGLRAHWDWSEFREVSAAPAGALAQSLLKTLARPDDDATVIVARSAY